MSAVVETFLHRGNFRKHKRSKAESGPVVRATDSSRTGALLDLPEEKACIKKHAGAHDDSRLTGHPTEQVKEVEKVKLSSDTLKQLPSHNQSCSGQLFSTLIKLRKST